MDTSSRQWIVCAAVLAALTTCGCNQDQKQQWDDFFNKKSSKQSTPNTPTVKASTVQRSAENQRPSQPKQDVQSQNVDQKVDHYVQSMESSDAKYKSTEPMTDASRSSREPVREERIEPTAARDNVDAGDDNSKSIDTHSGAPESQARAPAVIPPPQSNSQPKPLPVTRVEEIKASPAVSEPKENESPANVTQSDEPAAEPVNAGVQTAAKPEPASDEPPPSWSYDHFTAKFDSKSETAKPKPPVVEEIKVEAAPESKDDTTAAPAAPSARANVPPSVPASGEAIKSRIAEQEAKVARDPNNVDEQFKLRLLYLSDNQDEKALASTPGINADILDIMRAQIQSLISARSSAQRDPALWANRQLEAIENLRALVRARADIRVTKVAICRSITSFGVYEPIDPPNFKIGQRNAMFLYVPIENYKTERTKSGMYRTLLSIRYSVIDSNGKELWSDKIENIEDIAREHRQDFYLGVGPEGGFVLPSRWGAGEYTIKVEVEDMLAQKINSNTTKFKIVS